VKGGMQWLLHRSGEENGGWGGPARAAPCRGRRGVQSSVTWREGERGPASGSCAGAVETGAGRAVSGAVRKQGSRQRTWAVSESVGRSGEGRSWAGPKSNSANFLFKMNFQTEHNLI
jgi:hypothetical protein